MAISERWRDSLKNNDFPGYSAQKIDKTQGSIKNVKNRQKTSKNPRNRDTVYIYIGKSHFSGIVKHRLQTMEDHSWQESSDSDQF